MNNVRGALIKWSWTSIATQAIAQSSQFLVTFLKPQGISDNNNFYNCCCYNLKKISHWLFVNNVLRLCVLYLRFNIVSYPIHIPTFEVKGKMLQNELLFLSHKNKKIALKFLHQTALHYFFYFYLNNLLVTQQIYFCKLYFNKFIVLK